MKTFYCILAFISCLVIRMDAQPVMMPDSITKNAMDKLDFLSGHWSGTGSIQMGREKHSFNQEETVSQKVNNSVLVIDGLGTDAVTNQVIHQAYAVISYDRS